MTDSTPASPVAITGLGVFSPIGIGADAVLESLTARRSGIRKVEALDYLASPGGVGGYIDGFDDKSAKKQYLRPLKRSIKVMCREIQFGSAAALQALETSGIAIEGVTEGDHEIDHSRFGIDYGANLMFSPPSELQDAVWNCRDDEHNFHEAEWGDDGFPKMFPLWLLKYLPNMPSCHISIAADARGPSNSITQDEASLGLAMGEAQRIINRGQADVMIAGATGTRLHPVKTMHSLLWDNLADGPGEPHQWCRPFERDRRGEVIAEGAGAFIFETPAAAEKRGATVYGRLLGSGSSCVVDRDGTPRYGQAVENAIRSALRDAGVEAGDLGHVNAHGSGDRAVDRQEAAGILAALGSAGPDMPVTALKSYFGNAGSGSGPVEVAGSLLALREGVIPATLNYETPDPDCPLNVVAGDHRPTDNKLFLKVSVTRVAQASAIVIEAA